MQNNLLEPINLIPDSHQNTWQIPQIDTPTFIHICARTKALNPLQC